MLPQVGQTVRVRTRSYLVEAVEAKPFDEQLTVVRYACLDDDAQGEPLEVVCGLELDTEIVDAETGQSLGASGFDEPRFSGPFCTRSAGAASPAPTRTCSSRSSGLASAFITDDVDLGKTIEAGLIATKPLLRRLAREIVVACPPSMLYQWQAELENRFGLTFHIMDRAFMERIRQKRDVGVNPWTNFPCFLVPQRRGATAMRRRGGQRAQRGSSPGCGLTGTMSTGTGTPEFASQFAPEAKPIQTGLSHQLSIQRRPSRQ
jgi:hypothetical protein